MCKMCKICFHLLVSFVLLFRFSSRRWTFIKMATRQQKRSNLYLCVKVVMLASKLVWELGGVRQRWWWWWWWQAKGPPWPSLSLQSPHSYKLPSTTTTTTTTTTTKGTIEHYYRHSKIVANLSKLLIVESRVNVRVCERVRERERERERESIKVQNNIKFESSSMISININIIHIINISLL